MAVNNSLVFARTLIYRLNSGNSIMVILVCFKKVLDWLYNLQTFLEKLFNDPKDEHCYTTYKQT